MLDSLFVVCWFSCRARWCWVWVCGVGGVCCLLVGFGDLRELQGGVEWFLCVCFDRFCWLMLVFQVWTLG